MVASEDRRFVRTEQAIREAFITLMNEKGFTQISVKQIVERSSINRGTFYIHYEDKYDLLNKMEQDLLESLLQVTQVTPYDQLQQNPIRWQNFNDCFNQFAHYVYDQGELFTLLQSEKGDPSFDRKFYSMCKTVWEKHKLSDILSIPQHYALTAFISITSSLMLEWVNSGFKETPEEFMDILIKIVQGIPDNILVNTKDEN